MNRSSLMLVILSLAAVNAWGQTQSSFTNSTPTVVPDGNPVGITEQFTVSGLTGSITDVQVQLDITGGFNGDLYAYLVDPQGDFSVLLNRVGLSSANPTGYSDAGFNITLDGAAANNIHTYQSGLYNLQSGQLTGTWAADGRNINPQSSGSVFDATSPTAGLNIFDGLNTSTLNGTWTLFLADVAAGGGAPTLNQAIVSIDTVPEPSSLVLLAAGVGAFCAWRRKS